MLRRREFVRGGLLATGALAFGPAFWRDALTAAAGPARAGAGPYGPVGAADENGLRLPAGFRSRVLARGGEIVAGTGYTWPEFPDGSATFAAPDGGWILVVNSEIPRARGDASRGRGGASAVRFRADGSVVDAYRILGGTVANCSGGPTPWGTWLSCEEFDRGRVWECDPGGRRPARVLPAMGVFRHEGAAVDPVGRRVYLTEDEPDGALYRYTPRAWPELSSGRLEVAVVRRGGRVSWRRVPDPAARRTPTREQVRGAARFRRGEGMWIDGALVYVATTLDHKVRAYNTVLQTIETLYDAARLRHPPVAQVDQVTASPSGDVFVCEDTQGPDPLDVAVISPEGRVARFLKATGAEHAFPGSVPSELTGVAFDPSGTRMYLSSQRAFGTGVTYEVTGPFRTERVDVRPPGVRLLAPRSVRMGSLARRGLALRLLVDEPARLTVTLRARRTLLARRVASPSRRGMHRLALRADARSLRRLGASASTRAILEVRAVDRTGNVSRHRRAIELRRGG